MQHSNLNGKYNAALTYAGQSIGEDMIPPANYARARLTYANALNASHQHDNAIEQYLIAAEKASSASPLDPEIDLREIEWARERVYMHRADHEYRDKLALYRSDYSHARDYFQNLTEKNESDTKAWMMRGICSHNLWQFDKAEECFNRVLEYDPTNLAAAEWMARVGDERQPHIILVDFSNEGIDFGSFIDDITTIFSWKPPEAFQAEFENLADVDGVAEATIWTVPTSHVEKVRLALFEIPVQKNSRQTFNEKVSIPWDAFVDLPTNIFEIIDFLRDVDPVELSCEVAMKQS